MRFVAPVALCPVCASPLALAQTPPSLPTCASTPNAAPYIASYDELTTPGVRRRVRLRYDAHSHSWTPAPALRMPMHHASSIAYDGYTMPAASQQTLELEIVAIDRRLVSFEASVRTWFFEYRVSVASGCMRTP